MSEVIERELGWEDEIENEGSPFVLLPAGEYDFVVEGFERSRYAGSEKVPPCNQAILTLGVTGADGRHAQLSCNLFLHSKFEWKLCQFFTCIGQRKHGEKLRMNWPAVTGAHGRIKVSVRKYTKRNGDPGESNDIEEFIEPTGAAAAPPVPAWSQGAF